VSYHLVIWCEGGQGCPALFVGPPSDVFGRTAEYRATVARARAAGWLRTWGGDRPPREHWYCPECRPDRDRRGVTPPARVEIPADCPF
jgi:hypothetical protein